VVATLHEVGTTTEDAHKIDFLPTAHKLIDDGLHNNTQIVAVSAFKNIRLNVQSFIVCVLEMEME
jgi:hypothetical protein